MLLLLLLFAVGSILASEQSPRQDKPSNKSKDAPQPPKEKPVHKFGCTFMNKNFAMETKLTALGSVWPNAPQYSGPITKRLLFSTDKKFIEFKENLDKIMIEEFVRFPFNSVDPFIAMFRKYKFKRFSKFYASFVPTYPPAGEDGITALMRVYERLVTLDNRVEESFILGTIDAGVDSDFVDDCVALDREDLPPKSFEHEGIVGVIPFSIILGNTGVILLDLKDFKSITPVIMDRVTHPLNTDRALYRQFFNYKVVFRHYAEKDYITLNYYSEKFVWTNVTRDVLERTDILYFGRSLCSFVQTTQKADLLELTKMITKFSEDGHFVAYVTSSVKNCKAMLYTDSPAGDYNVTSVAKLAKGEKGYSMELDLLQLFNENISMDQARFIRDVGNRTGLNQKNKNYENEIGGVPFTTEVIGGTLREKLKDLSIMCGNYPKFYKDVYEQYFLIHGDGSIKARTKNWLNKFIDTLMSAKPSSCFKS